MSTAVDGIDWRKVKSGSLASLDVNGDKKPDQVVVVTSGGLGTIGLAAAVQSAGTITFQFKEPVCQGRAPRAIPTSFQRRMDLSHPRGAQPLWRV